MIQQNVRPFRGWLACHLRLEKSHVLKGLVLGHQIQMCKHHSPEEDVCFLTAVPSAQGLI